LGWDSAGNTLRVSFNNTVPVLPDDGRVITTGEKNDPRVQPPKPPYDGVSRGGALSLIAQHLQNPCECVDAPHCVGNNQEALSKGFYIYPPGANLSLEALQNAITKSMSKPLIYTEQLYGNGGFFGNVFATYIGPDGQLLPSLYQQARGFCGGVSDPSTDHGHELSN
jgi:hypothetical protein